jgi:hypothetical protein
MFKEPNQDKERKANSLAPNNVSRKLSARDMALGVGRKASNEELEEYLDRPPGKNISLKKAVEQIKKKLSSKK